MLQSSLRVFLVIAVFIVASVQDGLAIGGSVAYGDISIYKEGELVERLTGKGPVEDGALLVCKGKCTIKSVGISLVPRAGTPIAVSNMEDTYNLYIQEGSVDFMVNSSKRKIAFYTPDGRYTTAEPVATDDIYATIKGRFEVTREGKIDISIFEGKMLFTTDEGLAAVDEGNTITTAINPSGLSSARAMTREEILSIAGFGVTTVTLGVIAEETDSDTTPTTTTDTSDDSSDSDSDSSASPSS